LSVEETLDWAKHQEWWIVRSFNNQIENEALDGIIEAGRTGISVLQPFSASMGNSEVDKPVKADATNKFIREGLTWLIEFEGESCRLPSILGLDYISVLLQHPLVSIGPLQLQNVAGGVQLNSDSLTQRVSTSLREEASTAPDEEITTSLSGSFTRDNMLDDTARRQSEQRLKELETEIAYRNEIGDLKGAQGLEKEHSDIHCYLQKDTFRGRSRPFADENERARQSVTHAIRRAFRQIQHQAPKTATHLESQINTGSEFRNRDATTKWQVRRN